MPQADLYYSADQDLSVRECLAEIERVISGLDSRAGTTKGRGHRIEDFHHSHVYLVVSMLPKPDRDAAYASKVGNALSDALRARLHEGSQLNVNIRFDLEHYV